MLRVGLTGGIACGKSLIAGLFRARGVSVVNDDDAARDAVAVGTPGLAAVVEAFGQDVLLADGSLDRPKLGRIVFGDDARRRRLMAATFPYIGALLLERLEAVERSGADMVVYESALLVENGQHERWRPLVVVSTAPRAQLQRLMQRNGLSAEEATARIGSQMPVAEKARLADFHIDNSSTIEAATEQFERVFERLARAQRA